METNQPWNWRVTVLKTIKMALIRPPMTNFKMTVGAVSSGSPLPPSIKALASSRQWGGVSLWTGVAPCTPIAGSQNKANFPFHQPCLFIGFWAAKSWTPLLVTLLHIKDNILSDGVVVGLKAEMALLLLKVWFLGSQTDFFPNSYFPLKLYINISLIQAYTLFLSQF